MNETKRLQLINGLSADLTPVKPSGGIILPALIWFVLSWGYVVAMGLYLGPLREGALVALLSAPQFIFETTLGAVVVALFCLMAFQAAIPGLDKRWLKNIAYFIGLLWISCYVVGIFFPALEPSMVGKRDHCVIEAYLYSTPPLLIGYFLIFRRFPLRTIKAGIYIAIGAGAIPALFMQIACMYDPLHTLTHHIGPIFAPMVLGALLGGYFTKDRFSKLQ